MTSLLPWYVPEIMASTLPSHQLAQRLGLTVELVKSVRSNPAYASLKRMRKL
jgi:hypothetical protein